MHFITFNICSDNAKAAEAFVKRAKALGAKAELVEHDDETAELVAAHNKAHGNEPPAAVAHDMDPKEALELAVEIEGAFKK